MPSEVFPAATTLVRNWMQRGPEGRADLLRYLLEIYARPLRLYLLGTSYASLGEPDDLVHGFFVRYVLGEHYLAKWEGSGKRLRRYLASGLLLYCKDVLRERRRHRGETIEDNDAPAASSQIDAAFDAAVDSAMVNRALADARTACAAKGQSQHMELFELFHIRQVPFARLAADAKLPEERVRVMIRTAKRVFAASLREIMAADLDTDDPDAIDGALVPA